MQQKPVIIYIIFVSTDDILRKIYEKSVFFLVIVL